MSLLEENELEVSIQNIPRGERRKKDRINKVQDNNKR